MKDARPELGHPSFDIDVIIFPKLKKTPKNIQTVLNLYNLDETILISSLMMELIYEKMEQNTRSIDLSVLLPRENNPLIHKLSYKTKYGRSYIPLLDLAHGWKTRTIDHTLTLPFFLEHNNEREIIRLNEQKIIVNYSFQTYESLLCEKKFIQTMNSNHADKRTKNKMKAQTNTLKKISLFHPEVNCKKINRTTKKINKKTQTNMLKQASKQKKTSQIILPS